eukprot:6203426-Pleurochrysis_carterae.AAC.4
MHVSGFVSIAQRSGFQRGAELGVKIADFTVTNLKAWPAAKDYLVRKLRESAMVHAELCESVGPRLNDNSCSETLPSSPCVSPGLVACSAQLVDLWASQENYIDLNNKDAESQEKRYQVFSCGLLELLEPGTAANVLLNPAHCVHEEAVS